MYDSIDLENVCSILHEVCSRRNIEFFIIGRTARDLHIERCARIGRPIKDSSLEATDDIDFALMVRDWAAFQSLREALLERSPKDFTAPSRSPQKILFRGTKILPLDLVPAGGIADDQGRIFWPPDGSPCMTVVGFQEAFADSEWTQAGATRVRFASARGLALLKLIAWNDNRARRNDIDDLGFLIRYYDKIAGEERLYTGPDSDLIEMDDFDAQFAWSRILGRDVGRTIHDPATAKTLLSILGRESIEPHELVDRLQRYLSADVKRALNIFSSFAAGVNDTLNQAT